MTGRIVNNLNRLPETDRLVRGLRASVAFRQTGIPSERDSRRAGIPTSTVLKLVQLSPDGLVSLSYALLQWLAAIGFVLCAVSFVGIVVVLYRDPFTPYPDRTAGTIQGGRNTRRQERR